MRTCHEAAVHYLVKFGWNSVSLCPADHVGVRKNHCDSPGKVPIFNWKYLQERRQVESLLVHDFKHHPNANVGVVLGPISSLIGIDVDHAARGRELLFVLSRGDLPVTPAFRTGKGFRLLYSMPADGEVPVNGFVEGPEGARVEVLSQGRQTVMPPSLHANGKRYEWLKGRSCDEQPLAQLPHWARSLKAQRPQQGSCVAPGALVTSGRHLWLFKSACSLRRFGACFSEIVACLHVINQRCSPMISEREVSRMATNACRYEPTNRRNTT